MDFPLKGKRAVDLGATSKRTRAMTVDDVNWLAVILGAAAAFGLGTIWFSPVMFGKAWVAGSHDIKPPASPPVAAMVVQALQRLLLELRLVVQAVLRADGAARLVVRVELLLLRVRLLEEGERRRQAPRLVVLLRLHKNLVQ